MRKNAGHQSSASTPTNCTVERRGRHAARIVGIVVVFIFGTGGAGIAGYILSYQQWRHTKQIDQHEQMRKSFETEIQRLTELGDYEAADVVRNEQATFENRWRNHVEALALVESVELKAALSVHEDVPIGAKGREELYQLLSKSEPLHTISAADHIGRSAGWLLAGKYKEALASARAAQRLEPNNTNALLAEAKALLRLRRWGEARAGFERVLRINENSIDAKIGLSSALNHLGLLEESLSLSEGVLADNPDDARAHVNRSYALGAMRRFDEALEAVRKAIALKPQSYRAHTNRAGFLAHKGHIEEALAAINHALELNPEFSEARQTKGALLTIIGDVKGGIAECQRAIELAPERMDARAALVNILIEAEQYERALKLANESIAINPSTVRIRLALADTLLHLGRYSEALVATDNALQLDENKEEGQLARLLVLAYLGRSDEFVASVNQMAATWSESTLARYYIGAAWSVLGQHDKALSLLEEIVSAAPAMGELARRDFHWKATREHLRYAKIFDIVVQGHKRMGVSPDDH